MQEEDIEKVRVIAFYLPQYHPTPENDEWWGKGFTEWTNVAKAKKLYPGHYQPKIPSDLGFYDLRLPQVREAQAELAKEAGIYGFCYYHYWFSKDQRLLEMPFNEVVKTGKPNLPFCLCWANETWYSKFWNNQGKVQKRPLAEQKYLGEEDNREHFYSLLSAFKDDRYMKVEGRLLFLIYQPFDFIDFESFKKQWNQLAAENDLPSFYFVGQTMDFQKIDKVKELGFDGVNHCHRIDFVLQYNPVLRILWHCLNVLKKVVHFPYVFTYKMAIKHCLYKKDFEDNVYPTMMPNWDHTPRSITGGSVLHNATPNLFERHAREMLSTVERKQSEHKIVFLKSWNEWGEGNYMEPDLRYGRGYIEALRKAIEEIKQ